MGIRPSMALEEGFFGEGGDHDMVVRSGSTVQRGRYRRKRTVSDECVASKWLGMGGVETATAEVNKGSEANEISIYRC